MYVFARKRRDYTNSSIDAGLIVFQVSVSFSQNKCHLLFFVSKVRLIKRKLSFISWVCVLQYFCVIMFALFSTGTWRSLELKLNRWRLPSTVSVCFSFVRWLSSISSLNDSRLARSFSFHRGLVVSLWHRSKERLAWFTRLMKSRRSKFSCSHATSWGNNLQGTNSVTTKVILF